MAITYLGILLAKSGRIMTASIALAFYLAVVFLTLATAVIMRRLGERFPRLNQWTIGVYRKK